jgi:peptide/nickel transport system substrate-binding protein
MRSGIPSSRLVRYSLLILCCFGLTACGSGKSRYRGAEDFPREKTLYIGGLQWAVPNSFNPLVDIPAFPAGSFNHLMYESLLIYNILNGRLEPLLGQSYEVTSDLVRVIMDPRARWSDGKPVVAQDAKFSFEAGRRFRSAHAAIAWDYITGITIDTVPDKDGRGPRERLNFHIEKARNNPLRILDMLCEINIVPEHVIEPLFRRSGEDFSVFEKNRFDDHPVVSGPYNLSSFSLEKIVLKRRDNYWGNAAFFQGSLPRPEYIIHPLYKSNDHYSIALQQGNLDISQTFLPRVWLKKRKGVRTWYSDAPFHIPGIIPLLLINVTRPPLSDRNFRRAMAAAVNYDDIRELAVSGYSLPRKPGLILPFGIEEKYYSGEDAEKYGITYDPALAKKILKDAGYVSQFDGKGNLLRMTDASGKVLPTLFIKSPSGWTDWEIIVRIAVKGMREAGIDVREGFMDAGLYDQNRPVGDFDLMMFSPSGQVTPSKPWSRFEAVMSSKNWKPCGEKMNENQGRYNNPAGRDYNPAVDSLIRLLPSLPEEKQKAAYRALNVIFMQDQPVIPVVYRPEFFYEFSQKHWTGFPTEKNPYAPPQCLCYGASVRALWEIMPVAGE